jgi:RNA polymerase sigma factor (sigma-70 family)
MTATPVTRPSLLVRLQDLGDHEAWDQFVELYAPLVFGFACKRGLQEADAADLTQEVLRAVAVAVGQWEYDPKRGSFRGWLYRVTFNKFKAYLRFHRNQCQGSGDSVIHAVLLQQAAPPTRAEWEDEYQKQLFGLASDRVRREFADSSWQAFWRVTVDGRPSVEVASELKLSVGAVYIAKSRILARLKEEIRLLIED